MKLDRYKIHHIELIVDRLVVKEDVRERLLKSLQETMRQGKGTMMVYDYDSNNVRFYSRHLMCPTSGIAFNEPAPHSFSFNSPQGACPHCNGLGEEAVFDLERIIPDNDKSIREGAIEPLGKYRNNLLFALIEALGRKYDFTIDDPVGSLGEEALNAVLYGDAEPLRIDTHDLGGAGNYMIAWEGVADYIEKQQPERSDSGADHRTVGGDTGGGEEADKVIIRSRTRLRPACSRSCWTSTISASMAKTPIMDSLRENNHERQIRYED